MLAKKIYEKEIDFKESIELEIEETVENFFVVLYGAEKDTNSQGVSESHDFNPIIKIMTIVSEGNTDILEYEIQHFKEKTGNQRAKELLATSSYVVHELLSIYLFDYIDHIYQNSFDKIMSMKCEKTAMTKTFVVEGQSDIKRELDMNEDEIYFSCVLTQKKNFHID